MIQIKTPDLDKIAEEFFDIVNPVKIGAEKLVFTHKGNNYSVNSLVGRIKKNLSNLNNAHIQSFLEFILDEKNDFQLLRNILTKDLKTILTIVPNDRQIDFSDKFSEKETIGQKILDIFDYEKFRENEQAYWFADKLNVKVCPYCNREYTFHFSVYKIATKDNELKLDIAPKILFDFDHYLPKNKFPYLCLSFHNLIPSCSICNSRFKHEIDFDLENYIYPYSEGFENEMKFKIELKSKNDLLIDFYRDSFDKYLENKKKTFLIKIGKLEATKLLERFIIDSKKEWCEQNKEKLQNTDFKEYVSKNYGTSFFYGNLNSFDIDLVENKSEKSNDIKKKIERAENNIRVFRLKEVYNQHKDYAMEIYKKSIMYSDEYLESLFKQYEGTLFKNMEQLKGMIFGNYISEDEIQNRPLAKLTRDIAEELGLI